MYEMKSRIRYSETDSDARLTYAGILNYMQDCAGFHSEDVGLGMRVLKEKQRVWLLTYWNIRIERRPAMGEEITVCTWPYNFKGIFGYRNFLIKDSTGTPLVMADSYWVLTNSATGEPVRVTEEFCAPYGLVEPRLDMENKGRKVLLPPDLVTAGSLRVERHMLDTNRHVNNARYVDMAREALPESEAGAEVCGVRAEYRKGAFLGDELVLKRGAVEGGYVISFQSPEGEIDANLELKFQQNDA